LKAEFEKKINKCPKKNDDQIRKEIIYGKLGLKDRIENK
jgi:hypothetical protein